MKKAVAAVTHVDSSVLVAALDESEPHHTACRDLLLRAPRCSAWTHALAETYSALTGGRLAQRLPPDLAMQLIEESLVPNLNLVELAGSELRAALRLAGTVGARGGAIYDFLHLRVAAAAGARAFVTLNVRHFRAVARPGDPAIEIPA